MTTHELTPEHRAILDALLPASERTGDARADWAAAVRVAMDRRKENTRLGKAAIDALRAEGVTWRELTALTDVPWATARRWGDEPPGAREPSPEVHLDTAS